MLHADIQGAELHLADEIAPLLQNGAIDYLFVSTHGGAPHLAVLESVQRHGYRLIAEHSMAESFSGLIVAARPGVSEPGYINIPVRPPAELAP